MRGKIFVLEYSIVLIKKSPLQGILEFYNNKVISANELGTFLSKVIDRTLFRTPWA
jgi:hypothetical protein